MLKTQVRAVQRAYPRIYVACHTDHRGRGTTRDSVSPRDEAILSHLDLKEPLKPSTLAKHLAIGMPTLSEAIDRLEVAGLVERRRAVKDRREVELRLTARGEALSAAQSVLDATRLARVLRRLSATERKLAVRGMEVLAHACRGTP
ncbi:MAG: MarR family transcriptional regulator [Archangium sp.]